MNITMSMTDLRALMVETGEVAANSALSKAGLLKPHLSKQEAYRLHGQSLVDRWIKEGLLNLCRDGSGSAKWRINRLELDSVARASNRHTFLTTDERKTK